MMNKIELAEILEKHTKWVRNKDIGERVNLRDADLYCADLRDADLRSADLRGAYLRSADLYCADLRDANLYCADLRNANFRGAKIDKKIVEKFYPICCPEVG